MENIEYLHLQILKKQEKQEKYIKSFTTKERTIYLFMLYLRSSNRPSSTSDISKIIVYIKRQFNEKINRKDLIDIFFTLELIGIGTLKIIKNHEKFKWNFWIFPAKRIYNKMFECYYYPMIYLREDKTAFLAIKKMVGRPLFFHDDDIKRSELYLNYDFRVKSFRQNRLIRNETCCKVEYKYKKYYA